MPIYNSPIFAIDAAEARRYAGLQKADFSQQLIDEACMEAQLLIQPKGIWQLYDYEAARQLLHDTEMLSLPGTIQPGKDKTGADKTGITLTIGLNQKAFGIDSELHFNSQAAMFGQSVREMAKLLALQGAGDLDNLVLGAGDLYVTVYGGRTRLVGILLGRGLDIDEAKAELAGVTLESLVVAERVAKAIRIKAERGLVDPREFPVLMHIDDIITKKVSVDIPWEAFTFEK